MEKNTQIFEDWKQKYIYTLRPNTHVFDGYKYNDKEISFIYKHWPRDKP